MMNNHSLTIESRPYKYEIGDICMFTFDDIFLIRHQEYNKHQEYSKQLCVITRIVDYGYFTHVYRIKFNDGVEIDCNEDYLRKYAGS